MEIDWHTVKVILGTLGVVGVIIVAIWIYVAANWWTR